jgi:hypothetical protein
MLRNPIAVLPYVIPETLRPGTIAVTIEASLVDRLRAVIARRYSTALPAPFAVIARLDRAIQ